MRAEILIWSSISGAVLGLFAGVAAIALGVIADALLLPRLGVGSLAGMLPLALVVGLVVLPAVGAVLGYLEGRLKLE